MSLISAQNLVAPFAQKVHLFTIVTVCVLFAVFRYSGGAVRSTATPLTEMQRQPWRLETPASKTTGREATVAGRNPETVGYKDEEKSGHEQAATERERGAGDLLEDLIPKQKVAQPQQPAPKRDGFEDIEKSLGLK